MFKSALIIVLCDSLITHPIVQYFKDNFGTTVSSYPIEQNSLENARKDYDVIITLEYKNVEIPKNFDLQRIFQSNLCKLFRLIIDLDKIILSTHISLSKKICFDCLSFRLEKNIIQKTDTQALAFKQIYNLNNAFFINELVCIINFILHDDDNLNLINNNYIYIVNFKTLRISKHLFIPRSECQQCKTIDLKSLKQHETNLEPIIAGKNFRVRDIRNFSLNELKKDYIDEEVGILKNIVGINNTPFHIHTTNFLHNSSHEEHGVGRTFDNYTSQVAAILEGLERYLSISPKGNIKRIITCYDDIKDIALDPRTLGIHSEEQYSIINFPYQEFNPQLKISWVWAYSYLHKKFILIPEYCGYYDYDYSCKFKKPFFDTSSGCAIGSSLEEAMLFGILEVIERDATLMTWYNRLTLPEIKIEEISDNNLRLRINRFKYISGYDLRLFDMTLDFEVPGVWMIAENKVNPNGINRLCSVGCHINPFKAIENALQELSGIFTYINYAYHNNKFNAQKMVYDKSLVVEEIDHVFINNLPQARENFNFLLENNNQSDTFFSSKLLNSFSNCANIKEVLEKVISNFISKNIDVICLNQTSPEIERNSLHCVKMIIPGLLPMTYGYNTQRTSGLPRIHEALNRINLLNKKIVSMKTCFDPHPFS